MHYNDSVSDVFKALDTSKQGLNIGQVRSRLEKYGPNEIRKKKRTSRLKLFLDQFNNFIIYVLIAATIISALLGEFIDAIAIFVIVIINGVLGFIQESKAEKSIEALQRMAGLKARVIRDGKEEEVDSKELVPGDVLVFESGDKVPADARLFETLELKAQEAVLTGESNPVVKLTDALKGEKALGDRANMVFSGTIITNGRSKAVITETGMQSQIGRIASMLEETPANITPLQKKLEKLGKVLGVLVIVVCIIVFGVGVLLGGKIIDMFLAAVSLAVAAIPEGLPAVVTITLALGVQKMVKRNALIRKLPSVETLGGTTVICSDKTGTLTHNEMTVRKIYVDNKTVDVAGSGYSPEEKLSQSVDKLIFEIGALCNDASLSKNENKWVITGDPTEACLLTSAKKAGVDYGELQKSIPRVHELLFTSERKLMTTIHDRKNVGRIAYTKGAPDVVLKLCSRIRIDGKERKITEADKKTILEKNKEFAGRALRVLGFAYKKVSDKTKDKDVEKDLVFVGLQAMIDPPRKEVKDAIAKCRSAGIKVVMITGDYLDTAVAIAKELGIDGKAVQGIDLKDIDLDKEVENIGIYARVNPKDKLAIVDALKNKGHVVAMTGDGVNDAPAIKKADMGISMGITGTDVAKEASDMVLTDDNFASIVNAVEEGRTIFTNIRKFVNFLLACNLAEVSVLFFAMILATVLGFVGSDGAILLPLLPLHILWMNLVTDGLPALALGLDPKPKDVMEKRPRQLKEGIISKKMFINIAIIGLVITAATLFMFRFSLQEFGDLSVARTVALTVLIFLQFLVVEIVRMEYGTKIFSNKWLGIALLGSILLQFAIIYTPLNVVFRTSPLPLIMWGYIVVAMVVVFVVQKLLLAFIDMIFHVEKD